MVWLNPAAWIGLLALTVPVLIHILVQRKAERLAFPSLRFLQQTRLASIRRHVLEDVTLLAIRAAILFAAVAALAGPLIVTPFRRQAWNGRLVQAVVVSDVDGAGRLRAEGASASLAEARVNGERAEAGRLQPSGAWLTQTFETRSLSDGIHRARAWLDAAPPARRELVIISPLALGSVTAADLAAVPPPIGIRFERRGTLPVERTVDGGVVLAGADTRVGPYTVRPLDPRDGANTSRSVGADPRVRPTILQQTVELNGVATTVREGAATAPDRFPLEIICAADARRAADAAIAAVRSQRIWAAPDDRRARLVLVGTSESPPALAEARSVSRAWAADALSRIARDLELQAEASAVPNGLSDARFSAAPWTALALALDGRPLAVGAESAAGLVVVSGAGASSLVTPLLVRAIAEGIAAPPDLRTAEVLTIPDTELQAWTRPAGPLAAPRIDQVEQDDRRSLWVLVVGLLALETWVRRKRQSGAIEPHEEQARVA